MTVTEAARLMKMHPATVRRWIQRGWLPATRLPNGRYTTTRQDCERVVPKRGEPDICEGECRHIDCDGIRRQLDEMPPCAICGVKPVSGDRISRTVDARIAHWHCIYLETAR